MITIQELVVGLFVVSLISVGFVAFYTDVASTAGIDIGAEENLTSFTRMTELMDMANETQTATKGISEDPLEFNDAGAVLINAFRAIRTSIMSLNIFNSLISDTVTILGLPSWIALGIIGIIMIIISFALAGAVIKWRV